MLMEKIQLEADENVLTQVRKHWFILFTHVFSLVIAGIAPFVLGTIFLSLVDNADINAAVVLYLPHIIFLYAAWLLVMWMMLGSTWTDYYLDVWTITNRRLIAIDQRGLFTRIIGSFRLERLQDMNVEIRGIIATFLDFGTLEAQTAGGSETEFRVDGLPHPRELKSTIIKATDALMDTYRDRPRLSDDGT